MTITHLDAINCTPAVPFALRGWSELIAAGWIDETVLIGWDSKAFVATEGGEIVGILIYSEIDWKKEFAVVLGYVLPERRGQGIYRALWQKLVERAREKERLGISGGTHVDNKPMQAVMEKLGRTATFIHYDFFLQGHGP